METDEISNRPDWFTFTPSINEEKVIEAFKKSRAMTFRRRDEVQLLACTILEKYVKDELPRVLEKGDTGIAINLKLVWDNISTKHFLNAGFNMYKDRSYDEEIANYIMRYFEKNFPKTYKSSYYIPEQNEVMIGFKLPDFEVVS